MIQYGINLLAGDCMIDKETFMDILVDSKISSNEMEMILSGNLSTLYKKGDSNNISMIIKKC